MPTITKSAASATKASPVVASLNTALASSYALMANTHYAHWNVEGSGFFSLHAAFQSQYEALFEAVDEIAERIRALDHYAIGGLRNLADKAGIEEFSHPVAAKDFIAALIVGHEKVVADLITLRDTAEAAKDLETQDVAIGRIQWHQKTVWMLKSVLK
ncbi:DNA-binding ferritin-like protein (oxidative damage protectant) [Opitutaceae bacterium TAV1]|nr:DNA-binding ferritin-like protein (oxidative damage protectant) [Opitutaceae bacterium TAV1]